MLNVLLVSFLALVLFFVISFITVLFSIRTPLTINDDYHLLEIGFPFRYYYEMWVDKDFPNYGWNLVNLLYDIMLSFLITSIGFIFIKRKRKT